MQPSEVTPLLGKHSVSSSSLANSDIPAEHYQTQQRQQLSNSRLCPSFEEDAIFENGDLKTQEVSDGTSESPPPGCGTALFLVLLFSLFISNIEGSLLLATHAQVAWDLGRYNQSQWLIVAYPLAVSAAEPVMGSLSNGLGRKRMLLISYIVFALAASVCGAAPQFATFIVGRVLAGIGGSGLIGMVNLIISDLVGLKDLAAYRSYNQAAMAAGRLLGGPVGGFLVERIGWRTVFIAQTPILLLAAMACAMLIPSAPTLLSSGDAGDTKVASTGGSTILAVLRSVDIGGALLLVCTITLGLLSIVLLGDGYSIHDDRVLLTLGLCAISGASLYVVERFLVSQPMLSRRLLSNVVVVLNSATADRAGLQLMPLVFGNIAGSIAAGILIKRSFSLTKLASAAMATSCLARAITYLLWYPMGPVIHIFPLTITGLSSSVTFATTFILLNSSVTKADQAMAVSSLLSLYGIGSALGTTGSKVVMTAVLRSKLKRRLSDQNLSSSKIIASLMGDHQFVNELPEALQKTIQQSVRDSFSSSRALSLAAQLATLLCLALR
ncbi:Vacuolar membrane amino acid uptake transporter fnx2 [Pseudocercospora fuligena]|uniref:Vacuolar membrane amino acid uptake transporter fnx2 n=1 Tax=Pseudocercospora fuligena TaxID=685502 RepID=A0A8H6RJT2_9PEZI|nr:Vacuolar membrane amino acid uptake transporter fnx2 [Pseudocercospora fuligena]